jgi:predicted Zn-dependent protease
MEIASIVREHPRTAWNRNRIAVCGALMLWIFPWVAIHVQVASGRQQISGNPNSSGLPQESGSGIAFQSDADGELQTGTALTRKGSFREAIPHLLAARGRVADEYMATFNLALCYVATSQFKPAIAVLKELRGSGNGNGKDNVDVENLFAQAYIGDAQPEKALASVQKAAALSPQSEKLYLFVADACMDHKEYALGLKVIDIGLKNLPQSARLHYERAMFLAQLDQPDQAKPQFELARQLAPESEIGHLAAAQQALFAGEIPAAIRFAREGVKQGYENPALLTVLGEALIRSGISPGQPDFEEAQIALEKAVAQRPTDPASQIALGRLYLMAGRLEDAIVHLKIARQLEPDKPAVYANLAKAFQRHGDAQSAQEALAVLEELNRDQADRIGSAPGDRKMGYAGPSDTGEHIP